MQWLCALLLSLVSCAATPLDTVRAVSLRLTFNNGVCSGTAVGPQLVLTADHCFEKGSRLLAINGEEAHALKIVRDGRDHALVKVTTKFPRWVRRQGVAYTSQRVRWIGNPAGEKSIYREGYVSRALPDAVLIDAQVWKGDSGAGVFNQRGELVGVVSAMTGAGPSFMFAVMYPLAFTKEQWREMA